jgi:hypothetical protein
VRDLTIGNGARSNETVYGQYKSSTYLVDPASGHMLVSKIKPCMSMHKPNMVKPRMAHYNSHCLLDLDYPTWITVVILELIHAIKLRPYGTSAFIRPKPIGPRPERW